MKYRTLLPLSLFLAIVHVGCSASNASIQESTAGGESADEAMSEGGTLMVGSEGHEWDELITQDASLDDALQLSEVDCPSAHELVESICALAARVCDIAANTADGETEERCIDGRSRCERAQDRTSNVCP